jgi:hypothetical protein
VGSGSPVSLGELEDGIANLDLLNSVFDTVETDPRGTSPRPGHGQNL